jgi:H+-translocating NAD(P) transhydrogenase subunit alpha
MAFDVRPEVAEQIESMGAEFVFLEFDDTATRTVRKRAAMPPPPAPNSAKSNWRSSANLRPTTDIVITTALIPGGPRRSCGRKDMVEMMKPGSVIIDLAAEKGATVI